EFSDIARLTRPPMSGTLSADFTERNRTLNSYSVMSDIKFACPQCQQHIQCEPGYAGMEINCPTCLTRIIVPGTPAPVPAPALAMAQAQAPAPPPPMPTRLATSTSAPATGGCPSC